jgi:hypothetical protein
VIILLSFLLGIRNVFEKVVQKIKDAFYVQ